jgi:hypothetical protein
MIERVLLLPMKANAQRSFGLSAMLALAVASLSGCVTANTLEHARTYKEYCLTRDSAPVARSYVVAAASGDGRWLHHKDKAAYDAELARLEEEGKIRHTDHQGNPGYYALVPLAVAADIALVPGYIIYGAMHLK